ncbi:GNAT family N-acetyltransferase [Rufibacter sediminis]|uniref:GNAT family N-acetyltransferase n=1 Tax=Rufibacter sediminis TaxID=2762756 RepID=A0ABR6VZY1_9BACT|nr:GNAT family N-acetyltransferase [Rufibacter sediminis]MBC3542394.1 GNAT family N-acetyltransferase [Rufibacter sediminis]
MDYILETERLRLRQLTLEDAPFIVELVNSPGWLQYIGDKNIRTLEQARFYLSNGPLKSYEQFGYGLSLVERKEDQRPIGMCGIINRDNLDTPDIGFAFLPEYIGLGYGFEIASATLAYAQKQLGLEKIAAITLPQNQNSIKLLEKIGLTYQHPFCFPGSTETLHLFST